MSDIPEMDIRRVGDPQLSVLECLIRHGSWPKGWTWSGYARTKNMLNGLVKRRMAKVIQVEGRFVCVPQLTIDEIAARVERGEVVQIPTVYLTQVLRAARSLGRKVQWHIATNDEQAFIRKPTAGESVTAAIDAVLKGHG